MRTLKKLFYGLLVVMLLGHFFDFLTTYLVVHKVGDYSWEKNKWVSSNHDLITIKNLGLFHAIALLGLYVIFTDFAPLLFPKKFPKKMVIDFCLIVIFLAYLMPTFILWRAVINNTMNVLFLYS